MKTEASLTQSNSFSLPKKKKENDRYKQFPSPEVKTPWNGFGTEMPIELLGI